MRYRTRVHANRRKYACLFGLDCHMLLTLGCTDMGVPCIMAEYRGYPFVLTRGCRARWQDKGVILLDDVLSALDSHVGEHVLHECITGILDGYIRAAQLLPYTFATRCPVLICGVLISAKRAYSSRISWT